jgi:hypothetical protein
MRLPRPNPLPFLALAGVTLFAACDQPASPEPAADVESAQASLSAGTVQLGSGILWHLPNNELHVWDMATGTSAKDLYVGAADRNVWTPAATGDFNKDGTGDILWRSTGLSLSNWLMTDTRVTGNSGETYNAPSDPFHTANVARSALTGDINGDGVADIVWNGLTYQPAITWFMGSNGTTTPTSTVTSALQDRVLVVGDFDNDASRKADVLRRRDSSDGMVTIEYNQTAAVNMEVVPVEWNLVGSGDFNGDQTVDVLWHNVNTGAVHIWYMKPGAKAVTANRLTVGTIDYYNSGWSVTGAGDFNHDGISDILWTHTSGVISIWTMAANGVSAYGAAVTIPAGASFAGIINLGPPTAPTNITPLPQYISSGNGQVVAPIRFNVPTQRVSDQIEVWEAVGSTPVFRTRLQPTVQVAPNTMQLSLSPSSFTGGANACIYLKAYEQGRVSALSPKVCLVSLPPPVASNDYTMPDRFGLDLDGDTVIDLKPIKTTLDALQTNQWTVSLNGCASNDFNAGGRITSWAWSEGATQLGAPQPSCTKDVKLTLGTHRITLTVATGDGRVGSGTFDVLVKNTNIVAMGDSLMSGEANPLKLFQTPSFWGTTSDAACHRSASAFSARAALALERSDPRSSVTYLSVACTGAVIEHIVGAAEHRGQKPQLVQVREALCGSGPCPKIDAVVFDGGVNDLGRVVGPTSGFGDLITFCIKRDLASAVNGVVAPHCGDDIFLQQAMDQLLNTTGDRLNTVAAKIKELAPGAKVFTGDYPDPTTYDDGRRCSGFEFKDLRETGFIGLNGKMSASDVAWLSSVNTKFTTKMKNVYGAATNAFKFVDYSPVFFKHGYCASDHWMQQYHESFSHQGDEMGTLHPNDYGHAAMAQALVARMVQEGVASSAAPTHVPMQTFVFPALATTRYDWGTSCTPTGSIVQPMHCCPSGWAMTGLNITNGGLLKCEKLNSPNGAPFLDTGTQRSIGGLTMHACPANSVMVGFHGTTNRFACQRINGTMSEALDSSTQDNESNYNIHTCTAGRAMTGAHTDQNKFGCATGAVTN